MNTNETTASAADWVGWARELQAIGQTGLHFCKDRYDRERYEKIGRIAAEMLAKHGNLSVEQYLKFNEREFGYATPKVDVRGVVFRENRLLLVREVMDEGRWTLPGGWADVNETPAEAVQREVREESGLLVRATKVLAVLDRERQGHQPPFPYRIYKLFFLCEAHGGELISGGEETSEAAFFARDNLPELSLSRVTAHQIHRFFECLEQPAAPTDFD